MPFLQAGHFPVFKISRYSNMKTFLSLFITVQFAFAALDSAGQQFTWAASYEVPNANEVKALAVHDDGSIYAIGVFDAPYTLPFTGNAYLLKAAPNGQTIWSETISGSLNMSDLAAIQDGVIITGQSNGSFDYRGQTYGNSGYYLFVMHIDQDGHLIWLHTDLTKYGVHTNISVDGQNGIAVRTRGQSNVGDWILIFDNDGNITKSKQISASKTLMVDMAYHNGWVYLNGGFNGPEAGIMVDTIER